MNIINYVNEYGVKNIRIFLLKPQMSRRQMGFFSVPCEDPSQPKILTEYQICEDTYSVADNFKITLEPTASKIPTWMVGSGMNDFWKISLNETFYISDLNNLLNTQREEYQLFALVDVPTAYQRLG